MKITITLSKLAVFEEVAQTSAYTAAKTDGDANAYERMTIVDEDESKLNRFWDESRADVVQALIRMIESEGMSTDGDTYQLGLNVSESFEKALLPSIETGLFSYFVKSIVGKWFAYTNKKDSGEYATMGKAMLEGVKAKLLYKKKPERPEY